MMKFPSTRNRWLMPRSPQTPDWAARAMGTRRRRMESRSVRVISNACAKRMRSARTTERWRLAGWPGGVSAPVRRTTFAVTSAARRRRASRRDASAPTANCLWSARALVGGRVTFGVGGVLAHLAHGGGELLFVEAMIGEDFVR